MAIKVLNEFLPQAEDARLGGIKVGSTLQIDSTGILETNQSRIGSITNCITQVSRDLTFDFSGTTLTLKKGSVAYIPNGFESDGTTRKFTKLTTTADIVIKGWTALKGYVVLDGSGTGCAFTGVDQTSAGSSGTLGGGNLWYDIPNNLVKRCNDSGATWTSGYSLPICICQSDGSSTTGASGISGVDYAFNGFGYMSSVIFSLPGVVGLIPYGIDEESKLAAITLTTTSVMLFTPSITMQTQYLYVGNNSLIGTREYTYDYNQNLNKDADGNISLTARSNVSYMYISGKISNFEQVIIPPTKFDEKTDVTSSPMDTAYWINGNKGQVFLDCTSTAGQYVGFTKYNSTNGKFVLGGYQNGMYLTYTDNATVAANTNSYTKQIQLMNEDGDAVFPSDVHADTFIGTAYQSEWADLAENYIADKNYPKGTLICFDGEKDITIAKNKVNGVISEKPAMLLDKKLKGLPVALCGKVEIRVVSKVKAHDKLVLYKNGVARKKKWYDFFKKTIAITLENKNTTEEALVMCVTQFKI